MLFFLKNTLKFNEKTLKEEPVIEVDQANSSFNSKLKAPSDYELMSLYEINSKKDIEVFRKARKEEYINKNYALAEQLYLSIGVLNQSDRLMEKQKYNEEFLNNSLLEPGEKYYQLAEFYKRLDTGESKAWLNESINANHPEAMHKLAMEIISSYRVRKENAHFNMDPEKTNKEIQQMEEKAYELIKSAHELGHLESTLELSNFKYNGIGTGIDRDEATKLKNKYFESKAGAYKIKFDKAESNEDKSWAAHGLSESYREIKGKEDDSNSWLKKSADLGLGISQLKLAKRYMMGYGSIKQDKNLAIKHLQSAIQQDVKHADILLEKLINPGKRQTSHIKNTQLFQEAQNLEFMKRDFLKAEELYSKAGLYDQAFRIMENQQKVNSVLNNPEIKDNAEKYYQLSQIFDKQKQESQHWLRHALELKHPGAMYESAKKINIQNKLTKSNINIESNDGIKESRLERLVHSEARAFNLANESQKMGNIEAKILTANLLKNGEGVEKNLQSAINLYTEVVNNDASTDLQKTNSAISLSNTYRKMGELSESFDWLKKSADLGSADSQLTLGMAYMIGEGSFEADKDIALDYLEKASQQGYKQADELIKQLDEENQSLRMG